MAERVRSKSKGKEGGRKLVLDEQQHPLLHTAMSQRFLLFLGAAEASDELI